MSIILCLRNTQRTHCAFKHLHNMTNSNERPNVPIINSETFSTDQSSTSVSQASNTGSRVSQLVNNASISNLIQSNSFLHSDLGILIETSQNMTNNATRQIFSNPNQSHSHAPEHVHQTVVNLQGTVTINLFLKLNYFNI